MLVYIGFFPLKMLPFLHPPLCFVSNSSQFGLFPPAASRSSLWHSEFLAVFQSSSLQPAGDMLLVSLSFWFLHESAFGLPKGIGACLPTHVHIPGPSSVPGMRPSCSLGARTFCCAPDLSFSACCAHNGAFQVP